MPRARCQAVLLRPERLAPGLEIGAMIQPRHVGMLGYLILTCRTLGEAMLAYQRYETLFSGQDMVEVVGQEILVVEQPEQVEQVVEEMVV